MLNLALNLFGSTFTSNSSLLDLPRNLFTEIFLAGTMVVFASVTSIVAFSAQPIDKNRFGILRIGLSQRAIFVPGKTTISITLSKTLCHFFVVFFRANKDVFIIPVLQSFEFVFLTYLDVDTNPTKVLIAIVDRTLLDVGN